MKTLYIFVTLLLAFVVFGNAHPDHRLPPHKQAAYHACLKKLDLSAEKLHELDVSEESSEEDNDLSCFIACVDKELGLMNEEGNYERKAALKDFPLYFPQEKRTNIVDTCLEQKGSDECETARLYHACLKKSNPSPEMFPELKKIHDDCRDKLSMTNEEVKKIMHLQGELKTDCFGACFMKSIGFLNQDGTFNRDVYIEISPYKESAKRLADVCAGEVGADDCETAALMSKCFKKNYVIPDEVSSPSPRE